MKSYKLYIFVLFSLSYISTTHAFKLQRVILATDANPTYIQFWPVVAHTWKNLIGLKPTLALIADESVIIDETLGDVIRFKPIPGVPTAQHAQIIRLFLPAYFPEEGCIISDIDMLPLNKEYFIESVASAPDNCFVVYRDQAYKGTRFPMCYNAALGKTFAEIFGVKRLADIPTLIQRWYSMGYGWNTDELLMHRYLTTWNHYSRRCLKLGHDVTSRIDRSNWKYDREKLAAGLYIDAHCIRPYATYKKEIDELVSHLSLSRTR